MSLTDIQSEITNLPESDYQELRRWMIGPERRRRQEERGKAELVLEERKAGIRDAPAASVPEDQADDLAAYSDWEDPGVIHDRMYGLGDRVRHDGRIWESTTPGLNHWEPGGVGVYDNVWRDVTDLIHEEDEIEETTELPQPDPVPEQPAEEPEQSAEEPEQSAEEPEQTTPEVEQPEDDPTPPTPEIPEWRAGLAVVPGEQLIYEGTVYTVVQGHTTMGGWEPENVPALFTAE